MNPVAAERTRWSASTDQCIVILDDVITSGAHFEAARRHLTAQFLNDNVIGLFWAKAEHATE